MLFFYIFLGLRLFVLRRWIYFYRGHLLERLSGTSSPSRSNLSAEAQSSSCGVVRREKEQLEEFLPHFGEFAV